MAFLPPRPVIRAAWKTHKALYRWSGGRLGLRTPRADKEGLAELTTIGRRSGQKRTVMIAYFDDGEDKVTLAMNGWDPAEPAWWLNLQTNPEAVLVTPDGEHQVVARAAQGDDHERLWRRWRELDPFVDKLSPRRIDGTPVVIFSPVRS